MPHRDRLQILLPRAIDLGYGVVASREFGITLFTKTQSYFHTVRLEKIQYTPSWVKVDVKVYQASQELFSVSGSGGEIPLEFDVSDREPGVLSLFNHSIDSEARFTLYLIGWQEGES